MARPAKLCKLEKGKFIFAQEGFVDTFNWMVDFIDNLKGEDGIKLDKKISDKPIIKPDDDGTEDNVEVVTSVEYDQESHQFLMTKRKLSKIVKFADKEADAKKTSVFTAVKVDV